MLFLLRLPSEALPAVAGPVDASCGHQSTLCLEGAELVLYLKRRKNKPRASRLVHTCFCRDSTVTCPVHVIGKALRPGSPFLPGITPHLALVKLREFLVGLSTPSAVDFWSHDLRRAHALDLQCSGTCLCCMWCQCVCHVGRCLIGCCSAIWRMV